VRDSSAGIGTLTWYNPETRVFTGLGHAVCDVDTGERMPLASGEAADAEITGCRKGRAGNPGELRGRFLSGHLIGTLKRNSASGIYGVLADDVSFPGEGERVPVAARREVLPGRAEILTTIHGTEPERYEIYIERVDSSVNSTRNMVIRVTDPRLLEETGGIVQGMSGSPILQNGKLVGAVTHVFVNDPSRGYAIFAETMLEEAEKS
jgi:stage IV sporulation protein B